MQRNKKNDKKFVCSKKFILLHANCPSGGIGRRAWLRAMFYDYGVQVRFLSRAQIFDYQEFCLLSKEHLLIIKNIKKNWWETEEFPISVL